MEATTEQKLKALYKLQSIDTQIDKLKATRGELPLEVSDLEDHIAGLNTRKENIENEVRELENEISANKIKIKEAQSLVKKYDSQLQNVKNNREYTALNAEIELQQLEQQAAEKRIKDNTELLNKKKEALVDLDKEIEGRNIDLTNKKSELETIIEETSKEESELNVHRAEASQVIEARLLNAYLRIRNNMVNGISVAKIERDSCSGCFASLPPQRQIDIKHRKKIIVCESCGRILVDQDLANEVDAVPAV